MLVFQVHVPQNLDCTDQMDVPRTKLTMYEGYMVDEQVKLLLGVTTNIKEITRKDGRSKEKKKYQITIHLGLQ